MAVNRKRYARYLKRLAKLRRGDKLMIAILAALLLLTILLFLFRNYLYSPEMLRVEILQNGERVRAFTLENRTKKEDFLFESELGYNIVRVEGKKIAIVEADCPDQDCVLTGWLYLPGDHAVCLPHRFIVRIRGYSAVDAVTF